MLALLLLAACAVDVSEHASERPPLVVERASVAPEVVLSGTLDPADSDELSVPRTTGWQLTVRWLAKNGADVKQGDRLVELDNSQVTARLSELELAIIRASNDLAKQRAQDAVALADKELEVERQRVEVAKAKLNAEIPANLIAKREWQQNQLALERARVAHQTAVDDLEAARRAARLEQDVKQLEYEKAVRTYERTTEELDALMITAPRDGVVVIADHPWFGRPLQVGDMVQPGFAAAKVSSLSEMRVKAQLSDVDDGSIAPGMAARCVLDAYPERVFPGKVESIAEIAREPSESSTRRFFEVVVALDETDTEVMRPGMSVRVDVAAGAPVEAVVAPRAGLTLERTDDGIAATAHLADGSDREVTVGLCTDQRCVVESGLAAGDRLRYAEDAR